MRIHAHFQFRNPFFEFPYPPPRLAIRAVLIHLLTSRRKFGDS